MEHDSVSRTLLRVPLILCLFVAPLLGAGGMVFVTCAVAAVTAYEGLRPRIVYSMIAFVVLIEMVYGVDVGVLTLAYLVAVVGLLLLQRLVTLQAWSSAEGWHLVDALRAVVVAWCVCAVMTVGSVYTGHLLYGYTPVGPRLSVAFSSLYSWVAFVSIVAVLVLLRRMDKPFRRPITFGI